MKAAYSPAVERARELTYWHFNRVWCCAEAARPWAERWNALAAGQPSAGFPPWPARWICGPHVEPCEHTPAAGRPLRHDPAAG